MTADFTPAAHAPRPSPPRQAKPAHVVPPGTREFGMYLLLASLGLVFVASMLGYAIFRFSTISDRQLTVAGEPVTRQGVPLGTLDLPWPLWVSSAVILLAGVTIHRALVNVRRERQERFRNLLVVTLLLSGLFVLIQTPALIALLLDRGLSFNGVLNGFLFFLILLHALHVIGGLIPLFKITLNAHAGRYDHEHYGPVKSTVMYWHFLEAVWVVMFGCFLALG